MQDDSVATDAYQLVGSSDEEEIPDGTLAVPEQHTTLEIIWL